MRNCDYYKTPQELISAKRGEYRCGSSNCSACKLGKAGIPCTVLFAYIEHEEPKPYRLKPCPLCGSEEVTLYRLHCLGDYRCQCEACGCTSGNGDTPEEALSNWNRRAGGGEK